MSNENGGGQVRCNESYAAPGGAQREIDDMAITDEELALAGDAGHDLQAFVRKFLELRKDAERWRKFRDIPATSLAPGPLRDWLFMRPGGAKSLDNMADGIQAVGAA